MVARLNSGDANFEARFAALVAAKRENAPDVDAAVRAIIADVRARGDQALIEYTLRFDGHQPTPATLRVAADEIEAAYEGAPHNVVDALKLARDRIEAYHRRQLPTNESH